MALLRRVFALYSNAIGQKRKSSAAAVDYCTELVRRFDNENFVATLLLEKPVVVPAMFVRAFNVEVSRVQENTSDDKIAAMRYQFWIDAISAIYSKEENVPSHPVTHGLYYACKMHNISKRNLTRLVMCRKANFSKKYFTTMEEIEKYAEESVSPIFYTILELNSIKNVDADHAASHLGKAQGIINTLRSVEILAKRKVVLLPQDVLMKHDLSQENVLRCEDSKAFKDAVFDVATRANQHLAKARSIPVPKEAKRVFLPAVVVDSYLRSLQKNDFSLFRKRSTMRNAILPISLYWNKIRSKY